MSKMEEVRTKIIEVEAKIKIIEDTPGNLIKLT